MNNITIKLLSPSVNILDNRPEIVLVVSEHMFNQDSDELVSPAMGLMVGDLVEFVIYDANEFSDISDEGMRELDISLGKSSKYEVEYIRKTKFSRMTNHEVEIMVSHLNLLTSKNPNSFVRVFKLKRINYDDFLSLARQEFKH